MPEYTPVPDATIQKFKQLYPNGVPCPRYLRAAHTVEDKVLACGMERLKEGFTCTPLNVALIGSRRRIAERRGEGEG